MVVEPVSNFFCLQGFAKNIFVIQIFGGHFILNKSQAVQNLKRGELFTVENVRSIRPGYGLHTRHLPEVLGQHAARDIERGTPLNWDLIKRQ